MKGFTTEIKTLQLKALEETAGNPQKMPDKTFTGLVNSIKRKGWYFAMPDVWEYKPGKYRIISGHHRIRAAIKAGLVDQSCNVIVDPSYTEEQAKKDLIESNERHGAPDEDLTIDFITNLIDDLDIDLDTLLDEVGLENFSFKDIYDFSDFDKKIEESSGSEEISISIIVLNKDREFICEWLANGEEKTPYGYGLGIKKRCGLL